MLVAAAAGYLVNSRVFTKIFSFTNYSDIKLNDFSLDSVISCLGDLIAQIGWQGNQQLLSLKGIASVLGASACFAGLVLLCKLIRKKSNESGQHFLYLFIGASLVICLIVYSQTGTYNCSYWIPLLPFVVLALIMGVYSMADNFFRRGTAAVVMVIVVLWLSSIATMQNPYISWVPNDLTIQKVSDWLVENGYTQGYATFWSSDVITELTDGRIEMWTVNDMNELDTNKWLQETSHDTETPEGSFFIIVTSDEYTQNAGTWKLASLTDYLVYGNDNYFVFAFDSVEEYMGM